MEVNKSFYVSNQCIIYTTNLTTLWKIQALDNQNVVMEDGLSPSLSCVDLIGSSPPLQESAVTSNLIPAERQHALCTEEGGQEERELCTSWLECACCCHICSVVFCRTLAAVAE